MRPFASDCFVMLASAQATVSVFEVAHAPVWLCNRAAGQRTAHM
jgi:hypothetical protein